jgi:hypothetical protein
VGRAAWFMSLYQSQQSLPGLPHQPLSTSRHWYCR